MEPSGIGHNRCGIGQPVAEALPQPTRQATLPGSTLEGLMLFATILACSAAKEDDSATFIATVSGTFTILDLLTRDPVAGVTVSGSAGSATSGTDGIAAVDVPADALSTVDFVLSGYVPFHLEIATDASDFPFNMLLISDGAAAAMAAVFGTSLDPTKGIVSIVVEGAPYTGLGGVTVGIDAPFGISVVDDPSSSAGYSEGDTTLDGSGGNVVFANVDAGDVTVTVTTPNGELCTTQPSATLADWNGTVIAGEITDLTYMCD